MPTRLLLPLLALTLAAACAEKHHASGCRTDAQCSAGSRCVATVCTAGSPPSATVRATGVVEAFALVQLDGSASTDPDGDLAEYVWTARAVDAACAPPEVAGRTSLVPVRFGCPGRFQIGLTVRDALGLESTPTLTDVVVVPSTRSSAVVSGADLADDHACSGSTPVCRPSAPFQLTAVAAQGLSVRWSVEPPTGLPLDATRRVSFFPSPYVTNPMVDLSTDGSAISGDWVFRVEALDAYGVVGAAHTRVTVRNRAPVVTIAPAAPFPHTFRGSVFMATGELAWSVVDPDGDPVDVTGIWRHVGDGTSAFDGDFVGSAVTFAVAVPYTGPDDALLLRGGAGLSRQIELVAVDSNGAVGRAQTEIVIGNRPPLPAGGTFDAAVPHRYDPARRAYVATLRAGTYVDPDGDPLFGVQGGAGPCATTSMNANDATVECAAPYEGVPDVLRLAGTRTYTVAVRDPWDAMHEPPARTVEVLNSAPILAATPVPATVCMIGGMFPRVSDAHYEVRPTVVDLDGDPVLVQAIQPNLFGTCGCSVTPGSAVCERDTCPTFQFFEQGGWVNLSWPRTWESSLSASDGSLTTTVGVSPAWAMVPAGTACP